MSILKKYVLPGMQSFIQVGDCGGNTGRQDTRLQKFEIQPVSCPRVITAQKFVFLPDEME